MKELSHDTILLFHTAEWVKSGDHYVILQPYSKWVTCVKKARLQSDLPDEKNLDKTGEIAIGRLGRRACPCLRGHGIKLVIVWWDHAQVRMCWLRGGRLSVHERGRTGWCPTVVVLVACGRWHKWGRLCCEWRGLQWWSSLCHDGLGVFKGVGRTGRVGWPLDRVALIVIVVHHAWAQELCRGGKRAGSDVRVWWGHFTHKDAAGSTVLKLARYIHVDIVLAPEHLGASVSEVY